MVIILPFMVKSLPGTRDEAASTRPENTKSPSFFVNEMLAGAALSKIADVVPIVGFIGSRTVMFTDAEELAIA